MRALTLWRPWPFAIFHAGKDVENRGWAAPTVIGEAVAIHAGKKLDAPAAWDFIERVCGVRPPADGGPTGIIGVVRFDGMLLESASPWFTGPIGWLIGWKQALSEPVACPGTHKLWTVPRDVERLVRRRLAVMPPVLQEAR